MPIGSVAELSRLGHDRKAPDAPRDGDETSWLAERIHRPDMLEFLGDSMGVPWPQGQTLPAGTRSLELQNMCAFRAYAELRLGSSELGAPEPGVAPEERGQLLHAALHILWRELRDSATLAGPRGTNAGQPHRAKRCRSG